MKRFACLPLLFVGVHLALADSFTLDQPFAFRLEEPTLRPFTEPQPGKPPAQSAYPTRPKSPEIEKAPPNSTPREFNGEKYYFILI